jgi:hypothetical protein
MRSISRLDRPSSRICNWDCRRYGSQIVHATIKDICWHGIDLDFRRSIGTLWVCQIRIGKGVCANSGQFDCCTYPKHEE